MTDFNGSTKKLRDLKRGDKLITYDPYTNSYLEDTVQTMLHAS